MFLLHDCGVGLSFRRLEGRPTKSLKTSLGYFCGETTSVMRFQRAGSRFQVRWIRSQGEVGSVTRGP